MSDHIILNRMLDDKLKINDYIYIHDDKWGKTFKKGDALIKIKISNQQVINLKLGARSFSEICPKSYTGIIYKILEVKIDKLICEEIFTREK